MAPPTKRSHVVHILLERSVHFCAEAMGERLFHRFHRLILAVSAVLVAHLAHKDLDMAKEAWPHKSKAVVFLLAFSFDGLDAVAHFFGIVGKDLELFSRAAAVSAAVLLVFADLYFCPITTTTTTTTPKKKQKVTTKKTLKKKKKKSTKAD